jgi:hypothetical protein
MPHHQESPIYIKTHYRVEDFREIVDDKEVNDGSLMFIIGDENTVHQFKTNGLVFKTTGVVPEYHSETDKIYLPPEVHVDLMEQQRFVTSLLDDGRSFVGLLDTKIEL